MTVLPKIRLRRLVPPVAVFLCALAVRLAYLAQDASSPFFWHRLIDASHYHLLALRFANHEWPGREALFRPPLYPLFLGALYRVFGDDIVTLKSLQAAIGALSCLLVYFIGRLAFERRFVAIAAAFFCTFCGTLIYYDLEPLSANLEVFLLLLSVLTLLRVARRCELGMSPFEMGTLEGFAPPFGPHPPPPPRSLPPSGTSGPAPSPPHPLAALAPSRSASPTPPAMVRRRQRRRAPHAAWALAGAVIGLAALNRGGTLLLVPFVLGWLWLRRRRPDQETAGPTSFFKSAAVLLLSLGAVVAPLAWHNARYDEFPESRFTHAVLPSPPGDSTSLSRTVGRIVTGRFSPLGWSDGINVYVGNIPELQEINRDDHVQHFAWFAQILAEPWRAGVRSASGHSRYFLGKTAAYFRAHPVASLRLLVRKAVEVVNGTEVQRGRRLYAERLHSSVLQVLLWRRGIAFPSGLFIPLGLLGLWLARSSWRQHGLLGGTLAAQVIYLLGFFVTARYRAPILPLVAIYAAFALERVVDLIRDRRAGLRAAAIFVVLLAVCNLPLNSVEKNPSIVEEYNLATELEQQQRLDEAIVHYQEALRAAAVRTEPDVAGVPNTVAAIHYNLGTALHRLGRLDEAIASYRAALQLRPESTEIQNALAQALTDAKTVKGASREEPGL
jgi:4-amino-4-deoxy-L-arabinose transferase-like glycosyltransferase